MTKITTRWHPIKYLLVYTFLFFCAVGTALMYLGLDGILQKGLSIRTLIGTFIILVLSLTSYYLGFSMFYSAWKNSPKITIDKYTIKIGSQIFYLKDIKDVILTGKKPFHYFHNMSVINYIRNIIPYGFQIIPVAPMESTVLLFNNGKEKILFDDMYSNISDIKLFLEQVIINKQEYNPILKNKISRNMLRFERVEIFKGNQLLYFVNPEYWVFICIIGLIVFFTFVLLNLLILTCVLCACCFYAVSWTMNYFGLTEDLLIIRKHNLFWKVIIYPLSEIKEIVFERQEVSPICMRVISKDFRNKVYKAASIRKKTWLEMKKRLEEKGVKVRDEIFS